MRRHARRYDDRGVNTFYLREGTWAFALRQWLGGVKFWLAQALIRAMGYPAIASKVWSGWLVRALLATLPHVTGRKFWTIFLPHTNVQ